MKRPQAWWANWTAYSRTTHAQYHFSSFIGCYHFSLYLELVFQVKHPQTWQQHLSVCALFQGRNFSNSFSSCHRNIDLGYSPRVVVHSNGFFDWQLNGKMIYRKSWYLWAVRNNTDYMKNKFCETRIMNNLITRTSKMSCNHPCVRCGSERPTRGPDNSSPGIGNTVMAETNGYRYKTTRRVFNRNNLSAFHKLNS